MEWEGPKQPFGENELWTEHSIPVANVRMKKFQKHGIKSLGLQFQCGDYEFVSY